MYTIRSGGPKVTTFVRDISLVFPWRLTRFPPPTAIAIDRSRPSPESQPILGCSCMKFSRRTRPASDRARLGDNCLLCHLLRTFLTPIWATRYTDMKMKSLNYSVQIPECIHEGRVQISYKSKYVIHIYRDSFSGS